MYRCRTHTLDPRAPEPFFAMLRTAGARAVGIAHPFSVGSPLFIGCRFDMEMHDWNAVDYIEVFNTSVSESGMGAHPMAEAFIGNSRRWRCGNGWCWMDSASRPSPEKIFTACPGTRR